MKSNFKCMVAMLLAMMFSLVQPASAQESWGSYAHIISAKGYEGKNFRLKAQVRAVIDDDSAAARLWVRIDNAKTDLFFENMWDNPIRNSSWGNYTIEGTIGSDATLIAFGALLMYNGSFYFDNFVIEVETAKDKWTAMYTADFEDKLEGWDSGIATEGTENGKNDLYSYSIVVDEITKSKCLLIKASNIPVF